ncbi:MAG: DUF3467 domain-containing protein [Chloroflexota bacterium]|nr:DUF3467 domain-containing protein [Chloroflexota bacterium]
MPERDKEPREIYTNSVNLAASLYEFVFHFGLTTPEWEENPEQKGLVARVRMSPQHAKALYIMLGTHLEAYEEKFQSISLPDDLRKHLAGEEE